MIELSIGVRFKVKGKEYEVVDKICEKCGDCPFEEDNVTCSSLTCDNVDFKPVEKPRLTIAFKLEENLLLFKVLHQDKEWYRNGLINIRSSINPDLRKDKLYIRGAVETLDNRISVIDAERPEEAKEILDNLINSIYYEKELVVEEGDWITYNIYL